jgi:hypothetical protein
MHHSQKHEKQIELSRPQWSTNLGEEKKTDVVRRAKPAPSVSF